MVDREVSQDEQRCAQGAVLRYTDGHSSLAYSHCELPSDEYRLHTHALAEQGRDQAPYELEDTDEGRASAWAD